MTADQFDALAKLLKLRPSRSREAARLVLVEGLPPSVAADSLELSRQAVGNVLTCCRAGLELAKKITK